MGSSAVFSDRRQGIPSEDRRVVDECLSRVGAKFDDAKVRSFVPLLVRRHVRDELGDSSATP